MPSQMETDQIPLIKGKSGTHRTPHDGRLRIVVVRSRLVAVHRGVCHIPGALPNCIAQHPGSVERVRMVHRSASLVPIKAHPPVDVGVVHAGSTGPRGPTVSTAVLVATGAPFEVVIISGYCKVEWRTVIFCVVFLRYFLRCLFV